MQKEEEKKKKKKRVGKKGLRNNAGEKSEHFPAKDGPFPNPCALSDKLK